MQIKSHYSQNAESNYESRENGRAREQERIR